MLQFFPSPWKPGLHVQLYEPSVLLQTASALQLCVSVAHSSMSEKYSVSIELWGIVNDIVNDTENLNHLCVAITAFIK